MKLRWQDLVLGFQNDKPLNKPFSGEISESGFYVIIGPNGCGKSTLLRTWLGLETPLSGRVWMEGAVDHSKNIQFVPQHHRINTYFPMTVREFLTLGDAGNSGKKESPHVDSLLKDWQLWENQDTPFGTLSGGQKTRALVARALRHRPHFLFLDEPLANLDSCCQAQLMECLHDLTHQAQTVAIMVDHHFKGFSHYLSETILFERTHNSEVCSISCEFTKHRCQA